MNIVLIATEELRHGDGGWVNYYFDKNTGKFYSRVTDGLGSRANQLKINVIDDLISMLNKSKNSIVKYTDDAKEIFPELKEIKESKMKLTNKEKQLVKEYAKKLLSRRLNESHPMDSEISELDKQLENDPFTTNLTIVGKERVRNDNTNPWATTGSTVTGYYVELFNPKNKKRISTSDVEKWAKSIWKERYLITYKIEVHPQATGKWVVEVTETVWYN